MTDDLDNAADDESNIDIARFNDPTIQPVKDQLAMLRYKAVEGMDFVFACFVLEELGQDEAREVLINYAIEQNDDDDECNRLMNELCDYCKKSA